MILDQMVTSIIYLFSCFGIFILGHFVFKFFRKDYNLHEELIEKDNAALALTMGGYYLGLIFSIGGVIDGPPSGLSQDLTDMLIYGVLSIVLLNISAIINDRFILYKFKIKKEILEDQNCGTGVVEFAIFTASGLNIFGAVYGHGGSILTAVVFWFLGQLVLIAIGKYYNFIVQYDVHAHIEKDNVAVGIGFAGAILAMGNLLRVASADDFISWGVNIGEFAVFLILGIIILPIARNLTDKILLPGRSLAAELVDQNKPNIGAAYLEACSYIGSSFLISWCV